MRLAYMIATPELKAMPMSWIGDYQRIIPRLAEIGYDGVELQVRNPAEFDGPAVGWFRAALDQLLPVAERLGLRIVLEPQMRFIGDFLNTIAETLEFIDTYGSKTLMFEGDTFHQMMEEKSLLASIVQGQLSGRMSYYQISDSNR